MLNVSVNIFFSQFETEPPLPGSYQYFSGSKCVFAQGHNTAEVGFEPLDLSLRSQKFYELKLSNMGIDPISYWFII